MEREDSIVVEMDKTPEPPSDYPSPGMELRLIERHARLKGSRVLEIGCGDGRLTREFAPLAGSVVAIEPDASAVKLARKLTAAEGITNVSFRVGSAERVRLGSDPFDVVLFSWSL